MREHPHLYEINTWPWLDDLSRRAGYPVTLADVPDAEWDRLRDRGIDIVYLMGVWRRSALGRQMARSDPRLYPGYDAALPGWSVHDAVGSAYCIAGYEPDARLSTWDGLAAVRAKLQARGMRLFLDFIPNHTGFDHPWVRSHPDRYVQGDEAAFRRDPAAYRIVEPAAGDIRFIACGRDPYFPPWEDVAQLDYSSPETRGAMIAELQSLARHADGARCDMAMLMLSDVFARTWNGRLRSPMPATEFWAEARAAVPGFTLLAEVYWDLEWRLQQLGFDFTYDKRLYDRLLHSTAADVRGHLRADAEYQRRSARFVENHDEARSAAAFGDRVTAAAAVVATLPGLRFFYQGQLEGRRVHLPVQLGRWRDEPIDEALAPFYQRLLAAANDEVCHAGEWLALEVRPLGVDDLVAWRWMLGSDLRIVVVNLGEAAAEGHVRVGADLPSGAPRFVFEDLLDGRSYAWARDALNESGLYVRLARGAAHVFRVYSQR